MEEPVVRPYEAADEAAVVALWEDCGLTRPQNDPWRDIRLKLALQPDLLLVATAGKAIVATVMAGYEGHRGWINYLGVAPAWRGRGLARRMMEEAETRLRTLGCPKVNLLVRGENRNVVAFYEWLGYEVEDRVALGKRLK